MDEKEIRNLVRRRFQDLRFTTKGNDEPITANEANQLIERLSKAVADVLIEYDRNKCH